MLRVIGLSGKMGAGKDTVAELLGQAHGFRRVAFADVLKREVAEAAERGALPGITPADVWAKPTRDDVRVTLQNWGMGKREVDPLYWVNLAAEAARAILADGGRVVFSDVRFANEAELVRRLGGENWRVVGRQSAAVVGREHASEKLSFNADLILDNSGTVDDLANDVANLVSGRLEVAA